MFVVVQLEIEVLDAVTFVWDKAGVAFQSWGARRLGVGGALGSTRRRSKSRRGRTFDGTRR